MPVLERRMSAALESSARQPVQDDPVAWRVCDEFSRCAYFGFESDAKKYARGRRVVPLYDHARYAAPVAASEPVRAEGIDREWKLPCEVRLPQGMTIGRGVHLHTLLVALKNREQYAAEGCNENMLRFKRPPEAERVVQREEVDELQRRFAEWGENDEPMPGLAQITSDAIAALRRAQGEQK